MNLVIARTPSHSLIHLTDQVLLRDLATLVAQDRTTTAAMLAHLAEVDARKLYLPAAHPSMFSYCVGELRLSEDAALNRIRAARTARQFPAIFAAVADGLLSLGAVLLLTPYLAAEAAEELLAAAANRPKSEIEQLLANRLPKPDVATRLEALPPSCQLAPGRVGMTTAQHATHPESTLLDPLAPAPMETPADGLASRLVGTPGPSAKVAPLSPERFALQVTIGQETHDKLRYAQALLGHAVAHGDVAQVLDRALDALILELEQRKFAACVRMRPGKGRRSANERYVPASVRREVWKRDGGQCTFVSEAGKRCPACEDLQFDHIDPVARGGQATTDRMRLRCGPHNQYAAECVYGAGFMQHKRDEARRQAAAKREAREARWREAANAREAVRKREEAEAREAAEARERNAIAKARAQEVIPWLRQLGFRADECRRAAALCEAIPDASLEERILCAIRSLAPAGARRIAGRPK